MNNFNRYLKEHNLPIPDEKYYFKIDDAKQKIEFVFSQIISDFKWAKEYDAVAEWLEDNKGQGLFLYGNCGRGKTMLAKYILPIILEIEKKKIISYYDIQDLKTKYDEIISKKLISLDDIGTEEIISSYGNKKDAFGEIMDIVEKKSKLIIVTSNLTHDQLISRYGIRVLERIKSCTKRIVFEGDSFR